MDAASATAVIALTEQRLLLLSSHDQWSSHSSLSPGRTGERETESLPALSFFPISSPAMRGLSLPPAFLYNIHTPSHHDDRAA